MLIDPENLKTMQNASRELGIKRPSLYAWAAKKKINSVVINNKFFIVVDEKYNQLKEEKEEMEKLESISIQPIN